MKKNIYLREKNLPTVVFCIAVGSVSLNNRCGER